MLFYFCFLWTSPVFTATGSSFSAANISLRVNALQSSWFLLLDMKNIQVIWKESCVCVCVCCCTHRATVDLLTSTWLQSCIAMLISDAWIKCKKIFSCHLKYYFGLLIRNVLNQAFLKSSSFKEEIIKGKQRSNHSLLDDFLHFLTSTLI